MTHLPDRPFRRSEIESLGISRGRLARYLEEGTVRRVLHAVYLPAHLEDTPRLRARCATLVLPAHCVVSDRSAAWIHGIDCYSYSDLAVPPPLEVVSMDGNDRTQRADAFGGKRALLTEDVCVIEGICVTTPLRTACDLACQRGRHRALAVLDAFRREYGLELADFRPILARYVGRRGVIQLRELVGHSSPLAESQPESWTRLTIIDEGWPAPEPQVRVHLDGYGWVRLDLAYLHLKICIEYDGEEFHSEAADRAHDQERRALLRQAGWIVIVVRKDGFSGAGRDRWLGELKTAIEARSPVPAKRLYARGETMTYPRRRR